MAIGIGANTAIFSVVDSVLLRPLPYPGAERLVRINAAELKQRDQWEGWNRVGVPLADFRQWQSQSRSYEELALYTGSGVYKTGEEERPYLMGSRVSLNLFSMLGAEPALGRTFKPEDEKPESERVVVLSHDFWAERYQASPNAVGQQITINDQPHTIVGVMPASFRDYFARGFWDNSERFGSLQVQAPTRTQIWLPLSITHEAATWHGRGGNRHGTYQVLARLKPGVTPQQAQAEISGLTAQIAERFPESNHDLGGAVFNLHEEVTGSSRRKMLLLAVAFSLVLLIACANVASLLLARGIERAKELAIRATLGAGHGRLLRQLLTECLLLAGLGGGLGLLLAYGMLIGIRPLIPADIPRADAVTLDSRALLFTLGLTVLTTLLFGLLPAWQATRLNLTEELKDAGRSVTESRRSRRWRHALVVSQVALTMILLTGAGLVARSFWRVYGTDPGYDTNKLVRMRIASPRAFNRERYLRFAPNAEDAAELDQYWQPMLARVRNLPGVTDAAFAGSYPLQGANFSVHMRIPGHVPANPKLQPLIHGDIVSRDYFRLLGVKLLQGRDFNDGDRPDAPLAIIVNETFARTYFPQKQAVGQKLTIHPGFKIEAPATIVGVVADVRARLDRPVEPLYYQTPAQSPLRSM
ncbi:MAG TPA: ADOP family duplicated permease, partial [Blastocatellia bacterium]|nr:ADOP family duplicated permease [Blastocatellia bacterium]